MVHRDSEPGISDRHYYPRIREKKGEAERLVCLVSHSPVVVNLTWNPGLLIPQSEFCSVYNFNCEIELLELCMGR